MGVLHFASLQEGKEISTERMARRMVIIRTAVAIKRPVSSGALIPCWSVPTSR
jgi:hypothetical protein